MCQSHGAESSGEQNKNKKSAVKYNFEDFYTNNSHKLSCNRETYNIDS